MSIVFFIIGLLIGSFINAFVYRLHERMSITFARSLCPHCKHTLSWFELIPLVSFIWQRGQCRHCNKHISWQYPLVELATAICFTLVYVKFLTTVIDVTSWQFVWWVIGLFVVTVFLIIIFVYDWKYYLILDKVTVPAMATALVWRLVPDFSFGTLLNVMLAGLVVGGFFLLQFVFSQGKWIGGGDIRLGLLMGFILGWPQVLVALALSYFVGAAVALPLLVCKKKKWSSHIPFGTFLTVGTFIALIFGEEIITWYIHLL